MAATAEALLNTLAGGGDAAESSNSTATGADAPGAVGTAEGSPDTDGNGANQAIQSGDASGLDGGNQQGGAAGDRPQAQGQPSDQVANLNAALRQERAERKRVEQQYQQQYAELAAKIEALSKPTAKVDEPPLEPDFLQDPKGYVDAAKAKLKELTEKLETKEKEQTEAQKQQQAAQETWNKVISTEQEFAAATPDYYDAINHVRAVRAEQIKIEIREAEDREATPEEVGRILSIQEAQGAAALIAKGKNPSKFYYEYAKTFGYQPKAVVQPVVPSAPKPDKEAVRTMGSGGAGDSGGDDEPAGDSPLGGLLAAAQNEHKAQFKRRK